MKRAVTLSLVLVLSLTAGGCELVGDILEFGFWVGVILVLVVAALAWGGFRMIQRVGRRRDVRRDVPPENPPPPRH